MKIITYQKPKKFYKKGLAGSCIANSPTQLCSEDGKHSKTGESIYGKTGEMQLPLKTT